MAHYAFIDENNIVVEVIVGNDESTGDWETYYGQQRSLRCLRTSYNTYANTHKDGGTPFRKNYAGIGYTYNEQLDAFIAPKTFDSWTLDENAGIWVAPVSRPDGPDWIWDEETTSWVQP